MSLLSKHRALSTRNEHCMNTCPYCAETVPDQAAICRFCEKELIENARRNDRTPCQHCGEWILREAKICRFCQREIALDNQQTPRSLPKYKIWKKAEDLTLPDVGLLLEDWRQSYTNKRPELETLTKKNSLTVLNDYIAEIAGKLAKYKVVNDQEVAGFMMAAIAAGFQWGIVCYAIGVEGALGNIDSKNVTYYLFACQNSLYLYLLGYLNNLLDKKKVNENYVLEMGTKLKASLERYSVFLATEGVVHQQSVEPKYAGHRSPLAMRLLSIDISGIKETSEG